jgi:hypothetical protein
LSSFTPVPRSNKYPIINNPGVYQSGPSEFTLKHPDDLAGATILVTTRLSTIFEIFDHHDAILNLPHVELKPEPFSWANFTKVWNAHAAEDSPRFVTWDTRTGGYLYPLILVTLADFNITCRAPKVITTVPNVNADTSILKRVMFNIYGGSKASSVASTTTTTTIATVSVTF